MLELTQSGMLTTRFAAPLTYLTINPGGSAGAPLWKVINYVNRETVTVAASAGSAGTVTGWTAHGTRTTLTVGGISGGVLTEAISAAQALDVPGTGSASLTAFIGVTASATQMVEMIAVTSGGKQYLFAARPATSGLSVYEFGSGGTLAARGTVADTATTYAAGITAMVSVTLGGTAYLYTASETEHGLTAFAVGAGGTLTAIDTEGPDEGVPVQGLSALEAVSVGGTSFIIAAAAGSSSLSVFRVASDGTLQQTDHLIDDLGTRFGGAMAMDALVTGGRAYIAVGGADDGISLFTLDPSGQLVLLCTVEDSAGASLADVSALRLAVIGGELQLIAASMSEAGLTVMRLDLSQAGPLLTGTGTIAGTAGDDLIIHGATGGLVDGGGGDDIIEDGAGLDSLRGGAGRDTFVLAADQTRDVILDFDPAQDRLDLSRWPFLRSVLQLTIQVTSGGVILSFQGETLEIVSANGQPISAAEVAAMSVLPVSRAHLGAEPPPPPADGMVRSGGAGNDTVTGSGLNDTLLGLGGDDVLWGRGGADAFYGGAGWDTVSYAGETGPILLNLGVPGESTWVAAGDSFDSIEAILATAFNDTLRGNATGNHLSGAGGDDLIEGFGGADSLFGGDGNDTLAGMDGGDLLDGGAGNDRLDGGLWDDTLIGGSGVDAFFGGEGLDVVSYAAETGALTVDRSGGANAGAATGETFDAIEAWWLGLGDDTFRGNAENEEARGGDGADRLDGNDGTDRLWGDDGRDTITGGNGSDELFGGAGDDEIAAGAGDDRAEGGDGQDNIGGGDGEDTLAGGLGNDTLGAGPGDDIVHGDAGDDFTGGGPGNDCLYGDDGDDNGSGSYGNDLLDGGAGNDNLGGGTGRDTLLGGAGNDTLGAGDWDDWLDGGDGDDFLGAGAGDDQILGGAGADRLVGGSGDDKMTGGAGADTFVINAWVAGESDLILDFEDGMDRINAQHVSGATAAAKLAALAPAEVSLGGIDYLQLTYAGHQLLVAGLSLAELGTDDFLF